MEFVHAYVVKCLQICMNMHHLCVTKIGPILYKLDKNQHAFFPVYYFQVESTLLENNYALLKIDSLYKYFPPFF